MNYHYSKSWYDTFMPTISDKRTIHEVQFIKHYLPLSSHSKILDICCGTGRHSINLAQAGYTVTGIDINSSALQKGMDLTEDKMDVKFLLLDMREIASLNRKFNGILNLWQSFGFFDAKTNESIIGQISNSLLTKDRFILDIFNYDFFINHLGKYEFTRNGINITETKTIKNGRLFNQLEYHELQKIDNYDFQIFTSVEIISLAEKFDFETISKCSDYNTENQPNNENPRMQFVFEKK